MGKALSITLAARFRAARRDNATLVYGGNPQSSFPYKHNEGRFMLVPAAQCDACLQPDWPALQKILNIELISRNTACGCVR